MGDRRRGYREEWSFRGASQGARTREASPLVTQHMSDPSDSLTLSIIMPIHRGFRRSLLALQRLDPPPDQVIIVADGAPKKALDLAGEFEFEVVACDTCSGPATARNIGAQRAAGEILYFVDEDVEISSDSVALVKNQLESSGQVAAVFGCYDDEAPERDFFSQYKNLLQHFVHQQAREEGFTFWTACGAIKREVFFSVGGFQEDYRKPSVEDIAFGYRLRAAGHTVRVCKTLWCTHLKRWSMRSLFRSDFFQRALPWADLILEAGKFEDDLNISFANRCKVVVSYLMLLSLIAAFWVPGFILGAVAFAAALSALEAGLVRMFLRKRGIWFAIRAMAWHWFFHLYSGLAFVIALARFCARRLVRPDARSG